MSTKGPRICVLSGGFGGARFVPGVVSVAGSDQVSVITNPGDDIVYEGGEVWPDFDSVLYALAGIFDEEQGWGRVGDTYPEHGWFRIGDEDHALSRRRSAWLMAGAGRAEAARRCCRELGVDVMVIPAAAQPYRSLVLVEAGWLPFQEWLVRDRASSQPLDFVCDPPQPAASVEAVQALQDAELVLLGPSNPVASLLPILAVPGIAEALAAVPRVVVVSPTVAAIPPATPPEQNRYRVREMLMAMLDLPHTPAAVAAMWSGLSDGFVMDVRDLLGDDERILGVDLLGDRLAAAHAIVNFGLALQPRDTVRSVPGFGEFLAIAQDKRGGDGRVDGVSL